MSTESDNIAVVIGGILIVVVFVFLYINSGSSSGGELPPSPPTPPNPPPQPPTGPFVFKQPVQPASALQVKQGVDKPTLLLETPVAIFVYDAACNCDVQKNIFQNFATRNAEIVTSYEVNKSDAAVGPLLAAMPALKTTTIPTVLFYKFPGKDPITLTTVTDATLDPNVPKAQTILSTSPARLMEAKDFTPTGDVSFLQSGFVFIYKTPCPKCDAYSTVVYQFAVNRQISVLGVDAGTSPGPEYLKSINLQPTDFPVILGYSLGKLQPAKQLPSPITLAALDSLINQSFKFIAPADGILTKDRWDATAKLLKTKDASKQTFVFVYSNKVGDGPKIQFQQFATNNPLLVNYDTVNVDEALQNEFFTASAIAAPTEIPIVMKFDIGGLKTTQTKSIFDEQSLKALLSFEFSNGIGNVNTETILVGTTPNIDPKYVLDKNAIVMVVPKDCNCDAKKRVVQNVFNKVGNFWIADASGPNVDSFFTSTKLDRTIVALYKWTKVTGVLNITPFTNFDEASVTTFATS